MPMKQHIKRASGCGHRDPQSRFVIPVRLLFILLSCAPALVPADETKSTGEAIYRYYCYQCHGYAGDASTLAASYLSPAPRNFTKLTPQQLPEDRIVNAVLMGRPGTAMVSFASVLDEQQAQAVADYVYTSLIGNAANDARYHSPENGWPNHERYADAFPFVSGSIGVDVSWEELTPSERQGKRLYESACVSCHDQPTATAVGNLDWGLRAVSFPREHFSHRAVQIDHVSAASPYALHDVAPDPSRLSRLASAGKQVYEANCAFCHAADGSGRNWIGSFLEPRPRDFTDKGFTLLQTAASIERSIRLGIPGSSMPAWRDVLTSHEIVAVVAYIQEAFASERAAGQEP